MMESSEEKKKIFYMIVLVLTLITMILGASLAYFSILSNQKEEGTYLYTGMLEINYIDGVYLKDPELIPIKNPDYNTYEGIYRNNFAVTSAGTLEQVISIDLYVTRNEFTKGALKYAIYNDKGEKMSGGYVPQNGVATLASNMYLSPNGTATYTLLIWLNNTKYNQNYEMGNSITGRIDIHSRQIKY